MDDMRWLPKICGAFETEEEEKIPYSKKAMISSTTPASVESFTNDLTERKVNFQPEFWFERDPSQIAT